MECYVLFLVFSLLACTGIHAEDALNTVCPVQNHHSVLTLYNDDFDVVELVLAHPTIVEKVDIVTSFCTDYMVLHNYPIKVEYQAERDRSMKKRVALEAGNATWVSEQRFFLQLELPRPTYTQRLILTFQRSLGCSRFDILGCETSEICEGHEDLCGDVGTCVGSRNCLCPQGMVGEKCNIPVENITVDNYEPIVQLGDTIYTQSAVLDISGDVVMGGDDGNDRRRHFGPFGGPFFNFHGFGGSMMFSQHGNSGFSGSSGSGHPSSFGACSSFSTPWNGFSQSNNVMFGGDHDHSGRHYMFSTHNGFHYSEGSSFHYQDNMLQIHVHYPSPWGSHDIHYHVAVPFWPMPFVNYNFGCSFSPFTGAMMFLNGYPIGSQLFPSFMPQGSMFNPFSPALCIGQCDRDQQSTTTVPPEVQPRVDVSTDALVVTGTDANSLADNNMLSILGTDMLNILITDGDNPDWVKDITNGSGTTTAKPTTTTEKVTATTAITATTSSATNATTAGGIFTPAPAAVVVTAGTSPIVGTTTASGVGPLCYDCANHLPTDDTCTNITQCYLGEVCAVFEDQNGFVHRCMKEEVCTVSKNSGSAQCWQCCKDDLCNKKCTASSSVTDTTTTTTTTTTTQATTTESCVDTKKCEKLRAVGYDVCADAVVAKSMCALTCGECP